MLCSTFQASGSIQSSQSETLLFNPLAKLNLWYLELFSALWLYPPCITWCPTIVHLAQMAVERNTPPKRMENGAKRTPRTQQMFCHLIICYKCSKSSFSFEDSLTSFSTCLTSAPQASMSNFRLHSPDGLSFPKLSIGILSSGVLWC